MANVEDHSDVAKDFAAFIGELAHGQPAQQLTTRFRELVGACVETGRKGKMTITLNLKPEGKLFEVTIESKITKPEHPLEGERYYAADDGALTREDPRQLKLPGRIIDANHAGPRIVPKE